MPVESDPPPELGAYESFVQFLRENLAPPVKEWLAPVDAFLNGLPPAVWVTCSVLFILIGGGSALFFRHEFIYRGAPDRAAWRDLRYWAILFVIPFAILYYLLGRTAGGEHERAG